MSITTTQWGSIMIEMLGLRSGATADDINSAASYAMDCGEEAKFPLPSIPENWDALLSGTIRHMQEFEGYKSRYLLIISKSTSSNYEYPDCFPKCSVKPSKVWQSTSLDNGVEELIEWVVANIPNE
jgi:hypothetical protein